MRQGRCVEGGAKLQNNFHPCFLFHCFVYETSSLSLALSFFVSLSRSRGEIRDTQDFTSWKQSGAQKAGNHAILPIEFRPTDRIAHRNLTFSAYFLAKNSAK